MKENKITSKTFIYDKTLSKFILILLFLISISKINAQSPLDDGTIIGDENFDAVVPPVPASGYFTYSAGTSQDFKNTVDVSATAANGTGKGVEFYYDATFSTDEEITMHTFANVVPGDYIIQYDINADFQGFSFESVISDGTTNKSQTVGIQNGFGSFQKRYTAQISISATSSLSFIMQMSPFNTGFTSSLVYIDNIELIKMNAPLVVPNVCVTQIQEEDFDAASTPPNSTGSSSFTNSVALSSAADVNGTGQGVEFSYTAFYNEVVATIDLVTFNNVSPGTYFIQYDFDESNTQTFVALSYYNEISDGTSNSLNYIVLDTVTGFAKQRTYPITITSTSNLSLRFVAGETLNNIQGAVDYYIDNIQLINIGTGATSSTDVQSACGSYTWIDGMTYTSSNNTATHTLANSNAAGCDSVVMLDLTITNGSTGTDMQSACGSYTWIDGMAYTSSNNTATHTLVGGAANGCDSIVTLNLTITNQVNGTDLQEACNSFMWIDGMTYTTSNNTATHTLVGGSSNGCDSIVTLNLTIKASTSSTDVQTACDTYTWIDGMTYTASNNTATFTETNAAGCDSVITLDLNINSSTSSSDVQTACDSYTWIDGMTYTTSNNTATFTDTNAAGCDSIITLDLTINNSTTSTDVQSACNSYTWIDGMTYTASNNTATFTDTNAAGCDSVITLDLTLTTQVNGTDNQVACNSFMWIDGMTYTASNNTATHTLVGGSANGCDSVITLNLTINNANSSTDVQTACDSYTWIDGMTYTASNNTATFTETNAAGCDSIITLDLTINSSTSSTDMQTACDSYTWIDGMTYTVSNNTATFTETNAAGCDSVITLDLTINNSTSSTDMQTACDSYTWIDGMTYTTSNNSATFTDTNAAGCDSVITLDLTINSSTSSTDVQTACDSYTWIDGMTYTASNNTATYTIPNMAGCDSVITLDLTINTASSSTDVQTACDTYTWIDGMTYTASNNTATFTDTNAAGCDSVITLDLTINSSFTTPIDVSLCPGESITLSNNQVISTAGIYNDSLQTIANCDSIIVYNVTSVMPTSSTQNTFVCQGSSLVLSNGFMITTAGTYQDTIMNAAGCDSTITYIVSLEIPTASSSDIHLCDGATFTLPLSGFVVSNANTYIETSTNANGCDSVVTYNVTTGTSGSSTQNLTFCSGDSITLADGTIANIAGTYTVMTLNASGCDETITYNIAELTIPSSTMMATICANDSYLFDGQMLSNAGTYNMIISNGAVNGCDSMIILNLNVNDVSTPSSFSASICEGDNYTFGTQTLSTTGIYSETFANTNGCDSIVELTLNVNSNSDILNISETICDGNTFVFGTQTLTISGIYTETFTNALGCDSVVELDLVVDMASNITETANVCEGEEYNFGTQTLTMAGVYTETFTNANGCEYQSTLTLNVNNNISTSENIDLCGDVSSYTLVNGTVVTEAGVYVAITSSTNGCDSSITYNVSTCVGINDLFGKESITIYPNPTNSLINISFENQLANENQIRIINTIGKIVYTQNNIEDIKLSIDVSSFASGVYYLQITSDNKASIKAFTVVK